MFGLFISLALLGLSAIDPIGVAAMPILLVQTNPFRQSLIFLGGSFASLMLMGIIFAPGFGAIVLHIEKSNTWLVTGFEAVAGAILLGTAATLVWPLRSGRLTPKTPDSFNKRLQLGNWQLFISGALLVAYSR